MRATVMHAAGDVRLENAPDATIVESTDGWESPLTPSIPEGRRIPCQ